MNLRNVWLSAFVVPTVLAASASFALAAPAVTSELQAFKVVEKEGKSALVAADKVAPGDVIEYRVEYRNQSKSAVKDLDATLPMPTGLTVLTDSLRPLQARASVDGRTFGPMPLRRRVKNADGTVSIVTIPASQIRFLRWTVPQLEAGKSISFAARARINR